MKQWKRYWILLDTDDETSRWSTREKSHCDGLRTSIDGLLKADSQITGFAL